MSLFSFLFLYIFTMKLPYGLLVTDKHGWGKMFTM